MTLFISLRSAGIGGVVAGPTVIEADPEASPLALAVRTPADLAARVTGKDVLIATHGFNVSRESGIRALGRLDAALAWSGSDQFIGLLWPGDWWLPTVNYPFEGATAVKAGRMLAAFCDAQLGGARSLSFASHSLGARLVLEAIADMKRPVRIACLTAAAINNDCLGAEYATAAANSDLVSTLASRKDTVLQVAYPVGDLIADLLHDDHAFGEEALGREGPQVPFGPDIKPSQISNGDGYDHSDYLPPGALVPPAGAVRWPNVAKFIDRAFHGERQTWP